MRARGPRRHTALIAAGARSTRYVLDGAAHGDLAFLGDSSVMSLTHRKPAFKSSVIVADTVNCARP